jgi:hypothetical protein
MKFSNIHINRIISENYTLVVLSLSLLIATILVLRCFNAVFYPILHCEDGTEMVAYFLNNPHPVEIFRFYNGYISLIPNTIGFLVTSLFPLYIVPYIMVAFSLVLSIAALSIFSLRRYRFIMPDDKYRVLICVIVALIPLGNHAIITTLTYSQWHIFIISLLMIIAPLPKSNLAKAAQFSFLALAVFSHPLSIVFIPICFVLLFVQPSLSNRITNIGIVMLVVSYQLFGINSTNISYKIDSTTFLVTFKYIVHRIIFEPVFGNNLRVILYDANQLLIINIFAIFVLCIIIIVLSTNNPYLKNKLSLFSFLLYVISVVTFISVVSRSMTYGSSNPWNQRYFYTQQLLLIFIFSSYIVGVINWKMLEIGAKIALIFFLFSYVYYLNVSNAPFFLTSKEQGMATIKFLQLANKQLSNSENKEKYPQQIILDRGGRWDIKINLQ